MRPSVYGSWLGFWQVNPWGEERADLRSAIVAQAIATGLIKKTVGPWRREDFMPYAHVDEEHRNRTLSQRFRAALNWISNRNKAKS